MNWPASTPWEALLYTAMFATLGIMLALAGFKLFDKFTPGDLQREIIEKNNVSAAIIGAAVVLGICIIIAAAVS